MPRKAKNYFKRGGTYYARVQVGGHTYRPSLRTSNEKEAARKADEFAESLKRQVHHGEVRHTWKEAVLKWSEESQEGVAGGTAKRYLVSLRQLDPFLADKHLDEITRRFVASLISARRRQGVTNATIRRDLTALSSVLRSCIAWEWRDDNPAKEFDRSIIRERRSPIRIPSDEEVAALVARAPRNFAKLIRWLDMTGCRQEEGASLERGELNMRAAECTFIRTKTNRPRTIKLRNPGCPNGVVTEVVTPQHIRSPFVFWHDDGARYMNVASRFAALVTELVREKKIKAFRCHDLRHRFAVRWLRNGGDIYELSRHLGHTSVKTTEIYLGHVGKESSQKSSQVQRSDGTGETEDAV